MNKVGVVTLYGLYNYGNRLQNYAVVKNYERKGFKAESLVRDDFKMLRAIRRRFLAAIGKKQVNAENAMSQTRLEAFTAFNHMCNVRLIGNRRAYLQNEFDFFSTGSDQVWNPNLSGPLGIGWYCLDFAARSQRIALAPSIGIDELSKDQARRLGKGLRGFPRVSVRERRGAQLIRECFDIEAEVICDPTLTLSATDWRSIANGRCTPSEPYIFTYLLGGVSDEAHVVLDTVTEHGRIPVVPLSDRQKPGEPDAGPSEFIDLIDHASHVVTDSFHAAVFSSILHAPLTIVHREGGASMFSRLEQLSHMLGIEEKVFGSTSFDLTKAREYEGVDEAISIERGKFADYLEGCLDG